MTLPAIYHYTCDHGAEGIRRDDLPTPYMDALSLTSNILRSRARGGRPDPHPGGIVNPDRAVRVKVACINWSHPARSHAAVSTVNAAGEYLHTTSFPTWDDAMAFADRLARFIRTRRQREVSEAQTDLDKEWQIARARAEKAEATIERVRSAIAEARETGKYLPGLLADALDGIPDPRCTSDITICVENQRLYRARKREGR